MKTLEQDKVEQLLQIIQNKPRQRIVHFTESSHIFTKTLSKLCRKYDHQYYLFCTKDVFYDKSMTKYAGQPHMHITRSYLRHPRDMIQDTRYDYFISTLDLSKEDKTTFLEKCSPLIRTGGCIIILIPSSGYTEHEEWRTVLEKKNYGSTHITDDLFEHYDVIVSKRGDEE